VPGPHSFRPGAYGDPVDVTFCGRTYSSHLGTDRDASFCEEQLSDSILTTQEIAVELRCSKAQVYRLLNGAVKDVPKLAYISLGRKKVVRRSTLEDWKRVNEGCIVSDDADSDAVARAS
jgi:hypothetical protein